jgi:hypothetical protein
MKIETQGHNECMLATFAAVSRMPLSEVRDLALSLSGAKSWNDVLSVPCWAEGIIYKMAKWKKIPAEAFIPPFLYMSDYVPVGSNSYDLSGIGTILIYYKDAFGELTGHIAPYEDWKIYNSSEFSAEKRKNGVTLEEYMNIAKENRFTEVQIHQIYQIKSKEEIKAENGK